MQHRSTDPLPKEPIDRLTRPVVQFMHFEASSGFVLLACTLAALGLANSPWADAFLAFWKTKVGFQFGEFGMQHSLKHWINDACMAVFFFVIGLEVKREIVHGELRDVRRAALPIAAALGGMVAPALLYLAFVGEGAARSGWGIPMATDIAFVVGCMSVLGRRVPLALRVMLLSLAIADDIGAILVIAVGYTENLSLGLLAAGFAGIGLVTVLARLGVRSFGVYTGLGALVWYCFHESGVHATIAGVILGLQTPAQPYVDRSVLGRWVASSDGLTAPDAHTAVRVARESVSPLDYLMHALHPWVAFVIMPVFALANAGVPLAGASLLEPVSVAVAIGLIVGKPLGIVGFSFLAVRIGLCTLPRGVGWRVLVGAGCLAGIGFTMALFIAGLALDGEALDAAKLGILAGSAVSAALGMALLYRLLPMPPAGVHESGGS